ncbi:hypothetical protein KUTeg_019813, partial [Tegillarca granosa]
IEEREPSIQIKPHIFIDGGIHAREWVSPATVLYFVDQDRLWRKNRNPHQRCTGVDLNRNFEYQWDPRIGGSTNPCSDVFSGSTFLSEAESSSLKTYLQGFDNTEQSSMIAYLTIHSYGQMWLYPWGYTSALPTDWPDLDAAAKTACDALQSVNGKNYVIGSSTNVLYSAAGGSDDHAKGIHKIKYSYTLELRDTGTYGFQLPENQILQTAEETWTGVQAFAAYLANNHCANSNNECIWQ